VRSPADGNGLARRNKTEPTGKLRVYFELQLCATCAFGHNLRPTGDGQNHC